LWAVACEGKGDVVCAGGERYMRKAKEVVHAWKTAEVCQQWCLLRGEDDNIRKKKLCLAPTRHQFFPELTSF
jgi:hypothetical protein